MIPVYPPKCQDNSWKTELKEAISDPAQLLKMLDLKPEQFNFVLDPASSFPMRVPKPFIKKMQKGNPADPLLMQVLSQMTENQIVMGYSNDPLAETNGQIPGLLHKYQGRVLLVLASACAINCRYCFRRHFPYQENNASGDALAQSIAYIANDPSISEVILSGGEPLMVNDKLLQNLFSQLQSVKHLKRIRIHTRLPVVIPTRITKDLVDLLQNTAIKTSLVLHINHPNEVDQVLSDHLSPLIRAGVTLLNQSVLLKGVNDSVSTLNRLSEKLFNSGILPYYLHVLDKVQGAAHFFVDEASAIKLIAAMRESLPGYLVPRLAREDAGASAKTLIA